MGFSTEDVALRLRTARKGCGISVAKVAASIGVTPQIIYQWESGKNMKCPTAKSLLELSKLYGVSTDWILSGEEAETQKHAVEYQEKLLEMAFNAELEMCLVGNFLEINMPIGTPLNKAIDLACKLRLARKSLCGSDKENTEIDSMLCLAFRKLLEDYKKETA